MDAIDDHDPAPLQVGEPEPLSPQQGRKFNNDVKARRCHRALLTKSINAAVALLAGGLPPTVAQERAAFLATSIESSYSAIKPLDDEILALTIVYNPDEYESQWLTDVRNNFYVDDIFCGASSVEEGVRRAKILDQVFNSGHFPLKKWATRSLSLGAVLSSRFKDAEVTYRDAKFKVLGVLWDQVSDSLGVVLDKALAQLRQGEPSKRLLLKSLSQIFDPLGLATPITINAKILLQSLWKSRRDWDDVLTGDHLAAFDAFGDHIAAGDALTRKVHESNPEFRDQT